jgi:hypothetical protein
MAIDRRPSGLRGIVPRVFLALVALCALAGPARADIAGTGTATIDSDTTVNPVTFTGGLAFDAGSFSVNGAPVDLGGDVGTMNVTMGTFDFTDLSHVTVAFHAESATPGLLAFDVEGSVVCGNDCLNGTVVLVGRLTNVGGSVALPGATYVLETALVLFEGDGSGKLGLNAFQSLPTPADLNVTVGSSGEYFNSRDQAAKPFAADVTFDEVSQPGETLMTVASSGAGALPFNVTKTIPPFVDVSTTAETHGPILVCLHFADADHDGLEDTSGTPIRLLRLLHSSSAGDAFIDITETNLEDRVCGFPLSLSPFVLGAGACQSDDDCDDNNPCTTDTCDTEFGECSNDAIPECTTTTTTTTEAPTTTEVPTTTTETSSTTTTSQAECGNGQVEGDEQCDSGSPGGGFVGGDCGFCTSDCVCESTTSTTQESTTTSTTATSSTTTTVVIPTTSTAAPTTTTTSSTTTTTIPACTDEETFASVLCRLDELIALVSASDVQDPLKGNLLNGLARGRKRLVDAEARFDAGKFKSARSKLKGTTRRLIGFVHRVEGLAGRRGIPGDLASDWTARADDIKQDIPGLVP